MFEQVFKNIDDVLWKEAGCTTELDYTEQASWLLFLKYLDSLEQDRAMQAELEGRKYTWILDPPYRWETWAAPKDKHGKLDHNKAMTGDDLRDFVDRKLFPYLHGFKQKATGPNTIEYKIGEIYGEIKNRIQSGYNLREIIDHVDELRFRSQAEKHELSYPRKPARNALLTPKPKSAPISAPGSKPSWISYWPSTSAREWTSSTNKNSSPCCCSNTKPCGMPPQNWAEQNRSATPSSDSSSTSTTADHHPGTSPASTPPHPLCTT